MPKRRIVLPNERKGTTSRPATRDVQEESREFASRCTEVEDTNSVPMRAYESYVRVKICEARRCQEAYRAPRTARK